MERTLIIDTLKKIGQSVRIKGWISSRRDHGKIVFLNIRDRSSDLQIVALRELLGDAREESVVEIEGKIQNRPDKLANPELATGLIEMQAEHISILEPAEIMPFEIKDQELNVSLPVLMDYRPLSLRQNTIQSIFKVQEALIDGFRKILKEHNFTEFQSPAIVANAPEGGSELFHIDYYDYDAYLAQSPQIYKQIMTGVYERVFTVCKAYRAEPSVTTRHLSEYISLDAEVGFIDSWEEIMDICETTIKSMLANALSACAPEIKIFNIPEINFDTKIPRIKLREAQKIIGTDTSEPDLSPEDERKICAYAKEQYGSDFIFITHFPTKKRPFYTFPDPTDPTHTLSFDLLFRGLEIVTGGQRINNYAQLVENIKKWGNKPEDFDFYLQTFKYGMPPEGGFAIGTERVTKQLLNLKNVSEASLFPRDMERIDQRLSSVQERKSKRKK